MPFLLDVGRGLLSLRLSPLKGEMGKQPRCRSEKDPGESKSKQMKCDPQLEPLRDAQSGEAQPSSKEVAAALAARARLYGGAVETTAEVRTSFESYAFQRSDDTQTAAGEGEEFLVFQSMDEACRLPDWLACRSLHILRSLCEQNVSPESDPCLMEQGRLRRANFLTVQSRRILLTLCTYPRKSSWPALCLKLTRRYDSHYAVPRAEHQ